MIKPKNLLPKISVSLLIASSTVSQAALIAHWNMDETAGNLADSSGNGITGIKQTAGSGSTYGEATVTAGTYGSIVVSASAATGFKTSIDMAANTLTQRSNYNIGTPALITNLISSTGGGTGTVTIMSWINLDSISGVQRIFGTGIGGVDGFGFGTDGSTLRFTTNGKADNIPPTAAGLTVGTWAHIAMTYNNNSVEFFVNGDSIGTDTNAGGFNDETANNYRFGSTTGGQQQFTGRMDELRIYDTVLTASEIQTIAAIPEPSSTLLLSLGGLALIFRRHK